MKKDTYDDISARRVLKTKQLLDNRLGYIFFQNLEAKDHFAMTLYVIGSFFSALAARDRVKVDYSSNDYVLCFMIIINIFLTL